MEFAFDGQLIEWRGPAPFFFIVLPTEIADAVKAESAALTYGWGVIPVIVKIADLESTTSLIPRDNGYYLPIKKALRVPLNLEINHWVEVLLKI